MSKKEYGKGFTLEDLQAQRQAVWDTRSKLGLKLDTAMRAEAGDKEPRGPLWNAMEKQDPFADAAARGQRAIAGMIESFNLVTSFPNPFLPGDPAPTTRSEVVGYFGGLPVFESNQVPNGAGYSYTLQPGGMQVGWVKPEPVPEQPVGRFRNLDFES